MKRTIRTLAVMFVCALVCPALQAADPFDDGIPAWEAFADWPPDSLRTRGYWLPWNSTAFQRANLFGRPVLFTLTVNWNRAARQLEQGALSDPEVLRAINADYVSVRVNADLRPDVRVRYGTGAWPGVFLLLPTGMPMLSQAQTRDLSIVKPIRTTGLDSESMQFLLREGKTYWERRSSVLLEVGNAWARADERKAPQGGFVGSRGSDLFVRFLLGNADRVAGGFGAAPKYIVPWLDEYAAQLAARGQGELREHSRLSLEAILESPLYDPVDGGLHRAAAAPGYRAIEYEKMLVGNTALVRDLTYSLRDEDSALLREALLSTVDFIVRVLGRPQGGFHVAQMADTDPTGGGAYWHAGADRRAEAPPVDPIVLAGPSALAGAALIRAGWLLDSEEIRHAGVRALQAVRREAYRPGRGIVHAIEPPGGEGIFLVSQADAAFAFFDAYELTGDPAYLEIARDVVDFARFNLLRRGEGALRDHLAPPDAVGLLSYPRWPVRANMRLARTMRRLELLGQGDDYGLLARRIVESLSADLTVFATVGIEVGLAMEELTQDPILVRIAGAADDPETRSLRRAAINAKWPWVLVTTAEGKSRRPGAVVSWRGTTKKINRPEALAAAIEDLVQARSEDE